jgi:V-type H+-transporting ATPase subunit C
VQGELTVDGTPVSTYLTRFQWDESRYPVRRPLQETVSKLTENIGSIEDDLKVRANEYSQLKQQAQQVSRRASGSLALRDVSDLIRDEDIVRTDFMTTLLVAVPRSSSKSWFSKYEYFSDQVVPRSSKTIHEDNDYILVTAVVFHRKVDEFKANAREAGFSPRDFVPTSERSKSQAEEQREMEEQVEGKRAELEEWCKTSFGEAFGAQVHLYAIRLFVESVLRYGLPPAYLCALLMPHKRCERKLRQVLANHFGQQTSFYKRSEEDESSEEVHPYVSLNVSLPVLQAA